MKTTILLLAAAVACFVLAACATPEVTAAAVTAVGASAVGIIEAIAPLLPPETLAKLQSVAHNIDGTVQATQTAVGTIADVITAMKGTIGEQIAKQTEALNHQAQALSVMPSREEMYLVSTGTGAGATAISRGLSILKHGRKPA